MKEKNRKPEAAKANAKIRFNFQLNRMTIDSN